MVKGHLQGTCTCVLSTIACLLHTTLIFYCQARSLLVLSISFFNCVLLTGVPSEISDECSRFISSIKGKYQERRINREKQWPPCHSDELVRLELVEREKGEGYSANTQRGREDEGIKRTPLAYGDLFKVESGKRRVRKVLVEGDAGIGKTTLCVAVSEDWANEKLFQQFELVLLLPLRMKAVASAGSLPELLKLLHPSPRLCDSVARYLEDEEGESVLIIADGWDELGKSERQEGFFLYQFLFGHRFCLMSVIVTSRPSASAPLHELPDIDRFVEVRGFSKEHIVEYIQSEFISDQGKADRLREQLEGNPLVESVCSVPLNCAIVCHLWRTLEEALPTTMTELYTKIIVNLVLRNIRKLDTYKSVLKLPKFDSLPADLQQSWWLLCEFAFQALEKDQLVFSQEELEAFFPEGLALDKRILCFGLLQSVESVGVGISFHFLHLTFQEYLAALHLTRQPTDKQLEVFQTHKANLLSPHRFKMVCKFFFGIRFNLEFSGASISFIQQTLECVAGEVGVLSDGLSVCHCAFEAHNDLINKNISQCLVIHPLHHIVHFSSRTAHDFSAVLYVIDNLQEYGYGLDINFYNASENQIKELMHILTSKKGKLQISGLDLSGSRLTVFSLQALESAVRGDVLANLENLNLNGSLTSDTDTNAKWLAALSGHCPNLKIFNLSNNNLGVPGASALAKLHVSGQIYLNKTNLSDNGLTILVEKPKVISCLGLADNDIHASGVSCLADAVCSGVLELISTFLDSLNLSGNPLGLEGTIAVGRILSSSHCKTRRANLSRCDLTIAGGGLPSIGSISCKAVGRQLCRMPQTSTIVDLDLNHSSFTGDGIDILAGFIHLCPGLEKLGTCGCGITSDDLIWLLGKLKSSSPGLCSKLEGWYLRDNQIDGRGVSALIDHLPLLPHLWCDKSTSSISSLSNNPVIHNSEVMERLKDELTRRRKRYEEEQTSFREREEEEKLTRHLQEIKREEEKLMTHWREEKQTREHQGREKRLRQELMKFFSEREGTDKISLREGDMGTDVVLNWEDIKIEKSHEEEEHEEVSRTYL